MAKNHSLFSEFWLFLKTEKKWWLAPVLLILGVVAVVLVAAQGSAVAPFVYTFF
ncbi:MAG: hypothetical protein HOI66_16940 [Verrucomicrobia bacterium]|jgi:hypothetical protein|nr:hypothetical protein [Verrucomicrobiota bacterium]